MASADEKWLATVQCEHAKWLPGYGTTSTWGTSDTELWSWDYHTRIPHATVSTTTCGEEANPC